MVGFPSYFTSCYGDSVDCGIFMDFYLSTREGKKGYVRFVGLETDIPARTRTEKGEWVNNPIVQNFLGKNIIWYSELPDQLVLVPDGASPTSLTQAFEAVRRGETGILEDIPEMTVLTKEEETTEPEMQERIICADETIIQKAHDMMKEYGFVPDDFFGEKKDYSGPLSRIFIPQRDNLFDPLTDGPTRALILY